MKQYKVVFFKDGFRSEVNVFASSKINAEQIVIKNQLNGKIDKASSLVDLNKIWYVLDSEE